MTADELRAFEQGVKELFEAGEIRGPVHLSGGNEEELIQIFKEIHRDDWVFCSYRNHYHALLHGIDQDWLLREIRAGRSMNIAHPERRFFTSAMVGGCLPIAVGVAAAIKRHGLERKVWCFVGDMAATTGAFHEALMYSVGHDLQIVFVVEDNGVSCDTPTMETWGVGESREKILRGYDYKRKWPHVGTGKFVKFPGF